MKGKIVRITLEISSEYVGAPIWSETTWISSFWDASFNIVFKKLFPYSLNIQEVLIIQNLQPESRILFSPSSFVLPYTPVGFFLSSSL